MKRILKIICDWALSFLIAILILAGLLALALLMTLTGGNTP